MRKLLLIAGAAALFGAVPAQAKLSEAQAECPARKAPEELGRALLDDIANFQKTRKKNDEVTKSIAKIAAECASETGIKAEDAGRYELYSSIRIGREASARALAAMGISTELVDRELDMGPGKANRPTDAIADADFARLIRAILASGVESKVLENQGARMLGYYINFNSRMHRMIAEM